MLDKTYNFLEESVCRDMLAYFRLSVDAGDSESFIRIANRPNRYISRTLLQRIKSCKVARNSFSLIAEQRGISWSLAGASSGSKGRCSGLARRRRRMPLTMCCAR